MLVTLTAKSGTQQTSRSVSVSTSKQGRVEAIMGPGTDAPSTLASVMYSTPPYSGGSNGQRDYLNNWSSAAYLRDFGALGSTLLHCGGDGDYHGTEVYSLDYASRSFSRLSERATGLTGVVTADPNFDEAWGEHRSDGRIHPGVPHNYDCLATLPPSMGGGPSGSLLHAMRMYVYAHRRFFHPHAFDPTTRKWRRASAAPNIIGISRFTEGPAWCVDVKRRRAWGLAGTNQNVRHMHYLEFDEMGMATAGQVYVGDFLTPAGYPTARMWTKGDFAVFAGIDGQTTAFRLCGFSPDEPRLFDIPVIGDPIPNPANEGYGFAYAEDRDKFYIRTASQFPQDIWELTPSKSGPWISRKITMPGVTVVGGTQNGLWKRFEYITKAGFLSWFDDPSGNVYAWAPE